MPRSVALNFLIFTVFAMVAAPVWAQLTDTTQTPNAAGEGIKLSLDEQVGAGIGDIDTPDSAAWLIKRDPFRAIMRGRQLFQRKFTMDQGLGPRSGRGHGDIETNGAIGAGLIDSCAGCHGRPRGSAGFGGNVFTRPDSRDAPHLFGLGLVEMLADEMTTELRRTQRQARDRARRDNRPITLPLRSKGVEFGRITVHPNGDVDASRVSGVDEDLRVKPFFAQGGAFSLRMFSVGAFNAEMGLQSPDPVLLAAHEGGREVTLSGMVLDGSQDGMFPPPVDSPLADSDGDGVTNEIDPSLIDFMEFYLLNYFRPATGPQTRAVDQGRRLMRDIGCTDCHTQDLVIEHDRRVADVDTRFDEANGGFNRLFAVASPLFRTENDGSGFPDLKLPQGNRYVVRDIYTDLKRHDLGPGFWERNFDGTVTKEFVTEPLWGVGSTPPYGHDGRSINLHEVILRHGGEALASRNQYNELEPRRQEDILALLGSLVLFGPPDTASNLNPADKTDPQYPFTGHGSIDLSVLFNDPSVKE